MERIESTKNKKTKQLNKENKENIQPQNFIDIRHSRFQSQNFGEENIEGKYYINILYYVKISFLFSIQKDLNI